MRPAGAVLRLSRTARRVAGRSGITESGARPPSAVSRSGASGVTPSTWKSPTAPEVAAAAPIALSWSSLTVAGRSVSTATLSPTSAPSQVPSTG